MNDEPSLPHGGLSDSDCEELLAGRRADLPVGAMLSALQGQLGDELPGEAAAMATFRANAAGAVPLSRRGRTSARAVAAGVGAGVVLLGGVAAAASGQVRHEIGNVIGVHEHHQAPQNHDGVPAVTASPTPSAGANAPSPTASATSPTGHGKAHAGHGKGHGVGETAQPTHPSHPAHPTQAASPTHPAHPTKKAHPSQAANSTHTPNATHSAHRTKKPHPTPTPHSTHTPNGNST